MPSQFKKPVSKAKYQKKESAKKPNAKDNQEILPSYLTDKSFMDSLPAPHPDLHGDLQIYSLRTLLDTPVYVDPVLHQLVQQESSDPMIFDDFSEYELAKLLLDSIRQNNLQTFLVLLRLKERLNPAFNNNLALLKAIECDRPMMVYALLLDERIDPRQGSVKPVGLAVQLNNEAIKKLLFKHPLIIHEFFLSAVKVNKYELVKNILNKSLTFNPSLEKNKALKIAIELNNIKIVKLMLKDKRLEPSLEHNYPLRLAAQLNRNEIVKLLENDYRVKFKKLLMHIQNNETKECLTLFDVCFGDYQFPIQEIQRKIFTALILIIHRGNFELFQKLLMLPETNLGINHFYALKLVCFHGNQQMLENAIEHLLANHNKLMLDPVSAFECLINAIVGKHYDCIELLLKSRLIDPGARENQAIIYAFYKRDFRLFSLLVEDPRVKVCQNNCILHFETLKAKDLSYFELLYKCTPKQHLKHVDYVIENAYATAHTLGVAINRPAIEDIRFKYNQDSLTPLYSSVESILGKQENEEDTTFIDDVLFSPSSKLS